MQNYNPNGQPSMKKSSLLYGFGETTQTNLKAVLADLDLILPAIDLVPSPSTSTAQNHSASNRSSEFAASTPGGSRQLPPNPSAESVAPVRHSQPATVRDEYIHTSRGQFAVPNTESKFIQRERKLRNEFLHKKAAGTQTVQSTTRTMYSKPVKVDSAKKLTAIPRLKLVASGIAMVLIFCQWQLSHSFAAQQAFSNRFEQPTQHHDAVTTIPTVAFRSSAVDAAAPQLSTNAFYQPLASDAKKVASHAGNANAGQADRKQAAAATMKQALGSVSFSTPAASNQDFRRFSTTNLLKMGYETLRRGSAQESISIFSEAVRRDRNDPVSRRYLGYALLGAGRPAEAVGQFQALRKLQNLLPSDLQAMQQAVRAEQSMRLEQAVAPAGPAAGAALDNETLISKYRAAVLSDPKDLDSKYNLAVEYSKSGRTRDAIQECISGMTLAKAEEQQRFYRLYASLTLSSPSQS